MNLWSSMTLGNVALLRQKFLHICSFLFFIQLEVSFLLFDLLLLATLYVCIPLHNLDLVIFEVLIRAPLQPSFSLVFSNFLFNQQFLQHGHTAFFAFLNLTFLLGSLLHNI